MPTDISPSLHAAVSLFCLITGKTASSFSLGGTQSLPASPPLFSTHGYFFLVNLALAQFMRHVFITYYVQVLMIDAKVLVCIKTFWYLENIFKGYFYFWSYRL